MIFDVVEGILTIRNELATYNLLYRGLIFAGATILIGTCLLILFKTLFKMGKSVYMRIFNPNFEKYKKLI